MTEDFIAQTAHDTVEAMMHGGLLAAVCLALWETDDGAVMSATPYQIWDAATKGKVVKLLRYLADQIEQEP